MKTNYTVPNPEILDIVGVLTYHDKYSIWILCN